MTRRHVPAELKRGPITLAQAEAAGVTRKQLTGRSWQRITRGMYVWRALAHDPFVALDAAAQRLSPAAAFSGLTAAWLHGLDVAWPRLIEATVPPGHGISARAGMYVWRRALEPDDVVHLRGYPSTSICRTLLDLSWRLSLTESVVLLDAALHEGMVEASYLASWMALRRGNGGTARLRRSLENAEPLSESPMESRLRMLLVSRGLPRPLAQVAIATSDGGLAGRLDLYYPEQRLGIEYDGGSHRESLAEDDRRQNRLVHAGVRLLRFTAGDVRDRPDEVAALVAAHLRGLPQGTLAGERATGRPRQGTPAGERATA